MDSNRPIARPRPARVRRSQRAQRTKGLQAGVPAGRKSQQVGGQRGGRSARPCSRERTRSTMSRCPRACSALSNPAMTSSPPGVSPRPSPTKPSMATPTVLFVRRPARMPSSSSASRNALDRPVGHTPLGLPAATRRCGEPAGHRADHRHPAVPPPDHPNVDAIQHDPAVAHQRGRAPSNCGRAIAPATRTPQSERPRPERSTGTPRATRCGGHFDDDGLAEAAQDSAADRRTGDQREHPGGSRG